MALLRSPGLSTDPADDIHKALQALHPQEDLDHVEAAEPLHKPPRDCFDFIDGSWLKLQIECSKAGTGVDQWGWDSKEMWIPLKHNSALMDAIAQTWARPLAQGYLPPKYRDHLAGGRLIALSKHPKAGVRPICISDALRRLVAKGLNAQCKSSFTRIFQHNHPRALQFGANLVHGATHMYHLVNSIAHRATDSNNDDPIAIAALDKIGRAHV